MRNKILMIAAIGALVVGAVLLVAAHGPVLHAQGRGEGLPRKHFPGPEMVEHMTKILGLSDSQQAQIKTILEAARATHEPMATKLDEVHRQLEAATANGQFDEAQVRAIANQQAQLMADSIVEHERTKSKIYAVLTPEQRAKADEMHKHGGPHRRGGPPPPPPK